MLGRLLDFAVWPIGWVLLTLWTLPSFAVGCPITDSRSSGTSLIRVCPSLGLEALGPFVPGLLACGALLWLRSRRWRVRSAALVAGLRAAVGGLGPLLVLAPHVGVGPVTVTQPLLFTATLASAAGQTGPGPEILRYAAWLTALALLVTWPMGTLAVDAWRWWSRRSQPAT